MTQNDHCRQVTIIMCSLAHGFISFSALLSRFDSVFRVVVLLLEDCWFELLENEGNISENLCGRNVFSSASAGGVTVHVCVWGGINTVGLKMS